MKLLRLAVEIGWWTVVGAGLGFMAAAIVDGFVSPWQGLWTVLLMGAGALGLPAAAITVARRRRLTLDEARDVLTRLETYGSCCG